MVGTPKAISVISDAANYAVEDAAIFCDGFGGHRWSRLVGSNGAETQRIKNRDGACAHGENVAKDSANAGGGALKRLDETGMIVRFNFEGGNQAVADVDDAGIFSRALDDEFAAHGQALEMDFAGFVGAMLAPHHAKNAQLGDVGIASENFLHAGVLGSREAVFRGDFRRDFNFRACCRQFSYLEIRCQKCARKMEIR